MISRILFAAFTAGVCAFSASASTFQQSLNFVGTSPDGAFQQFDASQGTLNAVAIELTAEVIAEGSVTGSTPDGNFSALYTVSVDAVFNTTFFVQAQNFETVSCTGPTTEPAECTNSDGFTSSLSAQASFSASDTDLSYFVGSGFFGPLLEVDGLNDFISGFRLLPNALFISELLQITSSTATVKLTYDFDPFETDEMSAVPLPAGLPLMVAGLGAFGLLVRRRGRGGKNSL